MDNSKLKWCHEFTWVKCDCPEGKCSKLEQEFPEIPWHRVREEAKELFDSFYFPHYKWDGNEYNIDEEYTRECQVRCALIAVDKIIYYSQAHGLTTLTKFYEEVSKQLETYNQNK